VTGERWLFTQRIIATALVMVVAAQGATYAAEPDVGIITALNSAEFVLQGGADIPETLAWEPVELTDRWSA